MKKNKDWSNMTSHQTPVFSSSSKEVTEINDVVARNLLWWKFRQQWICFWKSQRWSCICIEIDQMLNVVLTEVFRCCTTPVSINWEETFPAISINKKLRFHGKKQGNMILINLNKKTNYESLDFHKEIFASGNWKFVLIIVKCFFLYQPQKITFYIGIVCYNIKHDYWSCGL